MTDTKLYWPQIFDLYRTDAYGGRFRPSLLATDLGVTANAANQMRRRLFIPVIYWPRLLPVLAQRLGREVTDTDLVAATIAAEASKREAA
jgi:hypothetical protein